MIQLYNEQEFNGVIDRLCEMAEHLIPTELNDALPSEWAESKRSLPRGQTPYAGPFSFKYFPYLIEILDSLAESAPWREVSVMKGTQVAYTTGVIENWQGYTIDISPTSFLNVSADAFMAEAQFALKLDALINQAGLQGKIFAQFKRGKQKKTGDSTKIKEFPGGYMWALGPNSGGKLRSTPFQRIAVDEVDTFKKRVGDEGNTIQHIRRRKDAYSENYKILWGSTPLLDQSSLIKQLFLQGDQRKYFVPCKHCGHFQFLKWGERDVPGGIKFERNERGLLLCEYDRAGNIISSSVKYQCEECLNFWVNADKDFFLPKGIWQPTAIPVDPLFRSYHVPALLSPVGFRSWDSGVAEFLLIQHKGKPKDEFQNWVNTYLAETFVDNGERPRLETILVRERNYHRNVLPKDSKPVICLVSADCQKDRIETEIVGWGRDAESWSIDYRVLKGDTEDPEGPVWKQLKEIILATHAGLPVSLTGIDSGYRTSTVNSFCEQFESGVHPTRGFDHINGGSYLKFTNLLGSTLTRIDLNSNILKEEVYRYLNQNKYADGRKPIGYCNFPIDYDREHYNRLMSEIPVFDPQKNKMVWDAGSRRNEPLDCRYINLGLLYAVREHYRELHEVEELPWDVLWDILEQSVQGETVDA